MATLFFEYGTGFQFNNNGGLAIAQGWDETRQYLERVAFTISRTVLQSGVQVDPEYLADPTFGLSLRLKVGQNLPGQAVQTLTQAIQAAAASAPGTNPSQPPQITVTQTGHTFQVIAVIYLSNGLSGTLSYQVA